MEVAGLAAAVGVPLITPEEAFSVKPAGSVPAVTVHAPYGAVPPVAESVCEYELLTVPVASALGVTVTAWQTGVTV